jgi:hypothetical protein
MDVLLCRTMVLIEVKWSPKKFIDKVGEGIKIA